MKVSIRELNKIIKEEIATLNKDAIEDTVMDVLSDEGGAAGIDPIADALEDLEDDEISLPEESIEDIIGQVSGVKRHADGDYVDTTQLESKRVNISKNQLKRIVRESMEELPPPGADRKPPASTDAIIMAEDYIQKAVYDGLEEMGLDENGANEVIRALYNRPDLLKDAIVGALNDYKRKLGMTGKPKPRNVDLFK